MRKHAGLDGLHIHDLRHSFASDALQLGEDLPMIGKLLGHIQVQTTTRYAHLKADPMKIAADKVAGALPARSSNMKATRHDQAETLGSRVI